MSLEDQSESQYTPSPCRFQAGIVGNRSLRNDETIGRSNSQSCAAKMAAFPVSALAHTPDWDSRLPGGGITSHWPVPSHAPPRWRRSQSVAEYHAVAQERDPPA